LTFYPSSFLVLFTYAVYDRISQGVQHAVGGAIAQDKVIGEGCDVFEFEQQDVFALLVFQGVDDRAGQFKCVQMSPRLYGNVTLMSPLGRRRVSPSVEEMLRCAQHDILFGIFSSPTAQNANVCKLRRSILSRF
jgi:hypothetical protein